MHSVEANDFGQFLKQPLQTSRLQQAQQKAQAFLHDHLQQPADVVVRSAQHRVQRIALCPFEVAAVHAVISFEVHDDRLDRLAAFEQSALLIGQPLVLASVFDLDIRAVLVHAPVAQVGVHQLEFNALALHHNGALLNLLVHGVTVIRVAWKAPGAHDQIALEPHGQTEFDAKFIRVAALALADALHLGRVPALELGSVVYCLSAAGLRDQAFGLVQGLA